MNGVPATGDGRATIGHVLLFSQFAISRKLLPHQLRVEPLFAVQPFATGGGAVGLPEPINHKTINPRLADRIANGGRQIR